MNVEGAISYKLYKDTTMTLLNFWKVINHTKYDI